MDKAVGERGAHLNASQATRAMNLKPDEAHLEKYDHYPAKGNPVQYLFVILAIGTLALTIYLFKNGHWIFGIIGIIGVLLLSLLAYSFGSATLKKQVAYENGLLIPAIIVNTSPVELLAMANMATKEDQEPIYGFLKMAAPNLPNHKIELNEKVPCVSLFGMGIKGYRRHFEARPICCGFKEQALIAQAIAVISKEPTENRLFKSEWDMLYALRDKIGINMKGGTVLLFDKSLNQANL
jgi:hypothetical protein